MKISRWRSSEREEQKKKNEGLTQKKQIKGFAERDQTKSLQLEEIRNHVRGGDMKKEMQVCVARQITRSIKEYSEGKRVSMHSSNRCNQTVLQASVCRGFDGRV